MFFCKTHTLFQFSSRLQCSGTVDNYTHYAAKSTYFDPVLRMQQSALHTDYIIRTNPVVSMCSVWIV